MPKFKFKKKYVHKIRKRNIILLIILFIIIGVIVFLNYINKQVTPLFFNVAKSETEKLATLIINDAVSKQLTDELNTDNLFEINKDNSGTINSIDFNSKIVNQVLTTTTNSVSVNLKYLEEGRIDLITLPDSVLINYDKEDLEEGIIYRVPSGIVFGNTILSNIGPKIPVKLNLIGSITSNVKTKATNYGINNALIEVYVNLKVTLEVILPFTKEKTTVKSSVPLAIKLVQGNVPSFYSNSATPEISLPIE